jgi:hypothetical protein
VLAVRIGKLEDSSLIGVRLGTMLAVVVAAPGYLLRYGTAKTRGCSTASFRGSRGTIASREADTYRTQMSDGHRPMRSRFTASRNLSV